MTADQDVLYLLVCRECTPEDPLVMPFSSAADRGKWAAQHRRGTGHNRWWVKDEPRGANAKNPA
jgi:hypothetical protein